MYKFKLYLIAFFVTIYPFTVLAGELSTQQKKELTVFGMKATGLNVGIVDVKKVLSTSEIEQIVAAGLNSNGLLCAQITDIRPLKVKSAYEVTCIAYRGGTATKTYIVDALNGTASDL